MARRLLPLLWTITAVVAAWTMVYATAPGIGVSPDSTVYIAAARQFLHAHGLAPLLATGQGIVPASIVPGYPFALVVTSTLLQTDPLQAARWLHVVLWPANVLLTGLLLRRALPGHTWTPWLGASALLVAPHLLEIHSMAWSEPLFLTLTLLVVSANDQWLVTGQRRWLAATVTLAAAVCLTRFAGVAVAAAVGVSILLWTRGTLLRRVLLAAGVGAAAVAPSLVWSAMTPGFRSLALHPPPTQWWIDAVRTLAAWLAPAPISVPVVIAVSIALGLLGVGAMVTRLEWPKGARPDTPSTTVAAFVGVLLAIYLAMLIVTVWVWDAGLLADGRAFAPAQIWWTVLAAIGVSRVLGDSRTWRRPLAAAFAGVTTTAIAIAAALGVAGSSSFLTAMHANGTGYTSRAWQASPLLRAVRDLPPDSWLISNANDVVVTFTNHNSRRVPSRVNASTMMPEPDYAVRMSNLRISLRRQNGFLAYFRRLDTLRWYMPSEADLVKAWNLDVVFEDGDGAIYRTRDRQ